MSLQTVTPGATAYQAWDYDPEDLIGEPDTFTADAGTDLLTCANDLSEAIGGQAVRFTTTGTLPGGLSPTDATQHDNNYFLGSISAGGSVGTHTAKVYPTLADARADTNAIDITSTGSGTHTMQIDGHDMRAICNVMTAPFQTLMASPQFTDIDPVTGKALDGDEMILYVIGGHINGVKHMECVIDDGTVVEEATPIAQLPAHAFAAAGLTAFADYDGTEGQGYWLAGIYAFRIAASSWSANKRSEIRFKTVPALAGITRTAQGRDPWTDINLGAAAPTTVLQHGAASVGDWHSDLQEGTDHGLTTGCTFCLNKDASGIPANDGTAGYRGTDGNGMQSWGFGWVRVLSSSTFSVHNTKADAESGTDPIEWSADFGGADNYYGCNPTNWESMSLIVNVDKTITNRYVVYVAPTGTGSTSGVVKDLKNDGDVSGDFEAVCDWFEADASRQYATLDAAIEAIGNNEVNNNAVVIMGGGTHSDFGGNVNEENTAMMHIVASWNADRPPADPTSPTGSEARVLNGGGDNVFPRFYHVYGLFADHSGASEIGDKLFPANTKRVTAWFENCTGYGGGGDSARGNTWGYVNGTNDPQEIHHNVLTWGIRTYGNLQSQNCDLVNCGEDGYIGHRLHFNDRFIAQGKGTIGAGSYHTDISETGNSQQNACLWGLQCIGAIDGIEGSSYDFKPGHSMVVNTIYAMGEGNDGGSQRFLTGIMQIHNSVPYKASFSEQWERYFNTDGTDGESRNCKFVANLTAEDHWSSGASYTFAQVAPGSHDNYNLINDSTPLGVYLGEAADWDEDTWVPDDGGNLVDIIDVLTVPIDRNGNKRDFSGGTAVGALAAEEEYTSSADVNGSGSATGGTATVEASGTVLVTGSGTPTAGSPVVVAAGTVESDAGVTGSGAAVAGSPTVEAAGTVLVSGVAVVLHDGPTVEATGTVAVVGTGVAVAGSPAVEASGTVDGESEESQYVGLNVGSGQLVLQVA